MNKKIFAPFLTALGMLAISVGSTFALFTSKSETDISITAANVNVSAVIGNLKTYSGEWNETTETYDTIERTGEKQGTFINGGTATISGSSLLLDRICPLDKVTFDINIKNNSDVSVKYRTVTKCVSGPVLFSILDKTVSTNIGGVEAEEILDGYENYTTWTVLESGVDGTTYSFAIEFKDHGELDNAYQNLSTQIQFAVEAVQGNAHVIDTEKAYSFDNVHADVTKEVSTKLNESGETVVDDTFIQNSDATASVIVPSNVVTEETANHLDVNSTLKLTVEAKEEQESSFVIKDTDVVVPYEIDVTKVTQVGSSTISEKLVGNAENLFEVKLFVGTGLSDVRVFHKDALLTPVDNLNGPKVDQTFYYNVVSGDLTIWTSSFSEYTIVYDNIPFIEAELIAQGYSVRIGLTGYKTLADAFNAQQDGETVSLMKDLTGQDVTWQKLTKGDYSFDLQGHVMEGVAANYARPTLQVNMKEGSTARIFDSSDNPGKIKGYYEGYPKVDQAGNHSRSVVYLKGYSNYTSHIDVVIEDITIEAMPGASAITNNIASSKQSLEIKSGTINGDIVLDLNGGGDVEVKVNKDAELLGEVNFIASTIAHKVESTPNDDGSTTYKTVPDYSNCDFLLTNKATAQGAELNTWSSTDPTSCSFTMGNASTKYYNVKVCRNIIVSNTFSFNTSNTSPVTLDLNGKTIENSNWFIIKSNTETQTITIKDEAGNSKVNASLNSYYGIQVQNVTLVIESGSFITSKFSLTNAKIVLKGGDFTVPTTYVETLKGFVATGSTITINGESYTK